MPRPSRRSRDFQVEVQPNFAITPSSTGSWTSSSCAWREGNQRSSRTRVARPAYSDAPESQLARHRSATAPLGAARHRSRELVPSLEICSEVLQEPKPKLNLYGS